MHDPLRERARTMDERRGRGALPPQCCTAQAGWVANNPTFCVATCLANSTRKRMCRHQATTAARCSSPTIPTAGGGPIRRRGKPRRGKIALRRLERAETLGMTTGNTRWKSWRTRSGICSRDRVLGPCAMPMPGETANSTKIFACEEMQATFGMLPDQRPPTRESFDAPIGRDRATGGPWAGRWRWGTYVFDAYTQQQFRSGLDQALASLPPGTTANYKTAHYSILSHQAVVTGLTVHGESPGTPPQPFDITAATFEENREQPNPDLPTASWGSAPRRPRRRSVRIPRCRSPPRVTMTGVTRSLYARST